MSFELPDLASSKCRTFTVCGQVKGNKKIKSQKDQKEQKEQLKIFSLSSGASQCFARVLNGGKQNKHIHIDFATKEYFLESKQKPPVAKGSKKDFFSELENFVGIEVKAHLIASYKVDTKSLPGFVEILQDLSINKGSAKASLIGGKMKFEGLPAETLQWQILDKKHTRLTLNMFAELTFNDRYFLEAFRRINEILDTIMNME